MDTIQFRLTGIRPLLMHADTFADPLNPLTKAHKQITGKRKKTDDDHEAIAQSEWRGSLYIDEAGPYIPGAMVHACMVDGGKLSKQGTNLKRSAEVVEDCCPLQYDGPRKDAQLWKKGFYDARTVKVGKARIVRYRPMFKEWAITCSIMYNPESIDRGAVVASMRDAGAYCGMGDYRPRFGRFSVEVI